MEVIPVGPAVLLTADNLTDPAERWTNMGSTRGAVTVGVDVRKAMGSVDQSGRTPLASSVYRVGEIVAVQAPLLDRTIAVMVRSWPGATVVSSGGATALAAGSGVSKVTARAFALVPVEEYTEGGAWWGSPNAIILPAAVLQIDGDLVHQLPEGEDALSGSVYTVSITSLGALTGATALRSGGIGQTWLMGQRTTGLDLVWEAGVDTGVAPLIGGAATFARASTGTFLDPGTGKLTSAAAGAPRFEAAGLLIEPQATNKVAYTLGYGTSGITGWTKGGDAGSTLTAVASASVAASGLDLIVTDGFVLRLDNSAGSTTAYATCAATFGNSNPHALSVYARGGAGGLGQSTVRAVSFAAATNFARATATIAAPSAASKALTVFADPGQVVEFVLAQSEEGLLTSVIPNATAGTATRAAESLAIDYAEAIDATAGVTGHVAFVPAFADAAAITTAPLAIGSHLKPRFQVRHTSGSGWEVVAESASTSEAAALVGDSFASGAAEELTFAWAPAGVKRWQVWDGDTDVSPAAASTVALSGAWGSGKVYVGNAGTAAGNPFAGWIKRIAVARGARTPAQMRALRRGA